MKNSIIANVVPYPPFAWLDNQTNYIEGFDADIIRSIGEEINIKIEIQTINWEKVLFNLMKKQCDLVIAALSITSQRLETIIFSKPYLITGQIVVVPKQSPINGIIDLLQKKIGVLKDTTGDFLMTKMKKKTKNYVKRHQSINNIFLELANGKIDAVVIDHSLALYSIKNNLELGLSIVGDIFTTEEYAIALRKEDKRLRDKINKGLYKITANGKYQTIYNKYF